MSYDKASEPTKQVQQAVRTSQDLQSKCQADSEHVEVAVAIREFPNTEYTWLYSKHDISIAQAKMAMQGYAVDTKTVMDSKCSTLVLIVDKDLWRKKEVSAERLPKEPELPKESGLREESGSPKNRGSPKRLMERNFLTLVMRYTT
jgi:hypothetical protein